VLFSQQKRVTLSFKPVADHKAIALNDTFYVKDHEATVLETFRFYISGLELFRNDSLVWKEKASYHLFDLSELSSIRLELPSAIRYDHLQFNLGIDSITNVSGAMGGDLDPTKGMYWSWQSGYINFKLEGRSSLCANSKKEFQLHLGGYQQPLSALQHISLQVNSGSAIHILFDVKQFLLLADLSLRHHIMSPGPEAVKLAAMSVHCFSIQP
jgi:hypothetical protein